MRRNVSMKNLSLAAIVIAVCSLTLGYAALTQTLNINMGATVQSGQTTWNIYFASSGKNPVVTGLAQAGSMSLTNTTVTVSDVLLKVGGDSVTYTFKVKNDGEIDAAVVYMAPTMPTFSGGTEAEQTAMSNAYIYKLEYTDGTEVKLNDTLKAKEERGMQLTLALKDNTELPSSDITISNLGYTLTYVEAETTTDEEGNTTIVSKGYYANGDIVYYNPNTGANCSAEEAVSTTGTNSGCMKWYVFNDSNNATSVNLLLDHNTTAKVAYNSEGGTTMKEVAEALATDTADWKDTARLISANEIAQIVGKSNFTGASSYSDRDAVKSDEIWLEDSTMDMVNYWPQEYPAQGEAKYKWLFNYTHSCGTFGCDVGSYSNSGYWTSSSFTVEGESSVGAWRVRNDGFLGIGRVDGSDDDIGVRPVISVSKSLVKVISNTSDNSSDSGNTTPSEPDTPSEPVRPQ